MILNLKSLIYVGIFLCGVVSIPTTHAGTMILDENGNMVVAKDGFSRKSLTCDSQTVFIMMGGSDGKTRNFTVEYLDRDPKSPRFMTITNSVGEHVSKAHNMHAAELKCLPSEEKIGLFIPPLDDRISALYLMIMKDGRVFNGYNMSGHDQTALDK